MKIINIQKPNSIYRFAASSDFIDWLKSRSSAKCRKSNDAISNILLLLDSIHNKYGGQITTSDIIGNQQLLQAQPRLYALGNLISNPESSWILAPYADTLNALRDLTPSDDLTMTVQQAISDLVSCYNATKANDDIPNVKRYNHKDKIHLARKEMLLYLAESISSELTSEANSKKNNALGEALKDNGILDPIKLYMSKVATQVDDLILGLAKPTIDQLWRQYSDKNKTKNLWLLKQAAASQYFPNFDLNLAKGILSYIEGTSFGTPIMSVEEYFKKSDVSSELLMHPYAVAFISAILYGYSVKLSHDGTNLN